MRPIRREQVIERIRAENPWWARPHEILPTYRSMRPRAYLEPFMSLVEAKELRRAVVLLGPRRVGKTVMLHHAVQQLLSAGAAPTSIWYVSVDHPLYNGLGLEEILSHCQAATRHDPQAKATYVLFDEVQYLRDWEVHLKALVDRFGRVKCIASGSAAAALRLKSAESGAGRFTDFLLPPLTFHEYLVLLDKLDLVEPSQGAGGRGEGRGAASSFASSDIDALNREFIDYLNFGGYPEAVFSPTIQADPARFIKSDIVDKVLLRDLPSLYGIQDIQELNYLFTTLAYNTAGEVSLGELAQRSGVAKNTLKRYIEYLEAAFLVKIVHRIDRNARRFTRAPTFKVYLTNPSMRSALFAPIRPGDEALGYLAETAVFSQWFHADQTRLHYARWSDGEVDIVNLSADKERPDWVVEVKWSDKYVDRPGQLGSLFDFCHHHNLREALVTTVTRQELVTHQSVRLHFVPASLYCYGVGHDLVRGRSPRR